MAKRILKLRHEPPAFSIPTATRAAIRRHLGRWYDANRRELPWRRTSDPYAIWVSEVMLQQTQVKTAIPYYHRFLSRFPDVVRLAKADEQSVLKAWEGLGYYSRARNMHKASRLIVDQLSGQLPVDWSGMRQLPGVGDYIAAAVLSIAHGEPFAVVDGNVKRVLARLFRVEVPVNRVADHAVYQSRADQLLDTADPGRHNQALMELGAVVCTPKQPDCSQCPIGRFCGAMQAGEVYLYPLRVASRRIPKKKHVSGIVMKNGRLLLTRRPVHGLLAGLWEFPGGLADGNEALPSTCVESIAETTGLKVAVDRKLVTVHHTYTHFKLQMEVYLCRWLSGKVCLKGPAAFRWVSMETLSQFPLHKAVHKALPALAKAIGNNDG